MQNQKVLILNFGGQYDQLIARRVRECKVYCEVRPYTMTLAEIKEYDPIGIIFTGGPDSVYKEDSLHPADGILTMGIPILGICYGCQLLAHHLGGAVVEAGEGNAREYGKTFLFHGKNGINSATGSVTEYTVTAFPKSMRRQQHGSAVQEF